MKIEKNDMVMVYDRAQGETRNRMSEMQWQENVTE